MDTYSLRWSCCQTMMNTCAQRLQSRHVRNDDDSTIGPPKHLWCKRGASHSREHVRHLRRRHQARGRHTLSNPHKGPEGRMRGMAGTVGKDFGCKRGSGMWVWKYMWKWLWILCGFFVSNLCVNYRTERVQQIHGKSTAISTAGSNPKIHAAQTRAGKHKPSPYHQNTSWNCRARLCS